MTQETRPFWQNFMDGTWPDGAALAAGQVQCNEWSAGGIETPFGRMKRSGFGREKGPKALLATSRPRTSGLVSDRAA
jgi:acyl-CoA reductase-like NAD-dependent aldehyde dehydrogenase